MNIILDTHLLLWAISNDSRLPQKAIDLISDEDNKIFYNIASVWEVEIKNSLGKISISGKQLSEYCKASGFELLQIKEFHIFELKSLTRDASAPKHNDPFDRIMLAQAKMEKYYFLTHDNLIPYYNEQCVIHV